MPIVLFTGYGIWGTYTRNPSWDLIKTYNPQMPEGWEYMRKQLPVLWNVANLHLIPTLRPDTRMIVCFGLSDKIESLAIETRAVNKRDIERSDASGLQLEEEKVQPGAPDFLEVTFPAQKIMDNLQAADVPVSLSEDAGQFVCNETLFTLLHHNQNIKEDMTIGFIHVPTAPVLTSENWKEIPTIVLKTIVEHGGGDPEGVIPKFAMTGEWNG